MTIYVTMVLGGVSSRKAAKKRIREIPMTWQVISTSTYHSSGAFTEADLVGVKIP